MKPAKIIRDEDGNKLVYCSKHKGYSHMSEFGTLTNSDRPRSQCRLCERNGANKRRDPNYVKVRKTDKELATEILTDLGYDVNSEVPLWIQFMMRHEMIGSKFTETSRSIIESQRSS